MFPAQILTYLGSATGMRFFNDFADSIGQGQLAYYIIFGLLILVFSYFWVSMMFKPVQIADDLKEEWWLHSWCPPRGAYCEIP
jgi:preprotein translocase subunit SecY